MEVETTSKELQCELEIFAGCIWPAYILLAITVLQSLGRSAVFNSIGLCWRSNMYFNIIMFLLSGPFGGA